MDRGPDSWYHIPVDWAVVKGITNGTSPTTFSPMDGCKRAQVVTFLWRAANEPEPKTTNNPFKDVTEKDYYYKAVLWAVENGITKGTSDTTFSPNDVCTREQVVTFLYRYENEPEVKDVTNPFKDVNEKDYSFNAILWAVSNEVTNGRTADTFVPKDTCKRAEVVTFLYRALAE